jgi:hypothetical protein
MFRQVPDFHYAGKRGREHEEAEEPFGCQHREESCQGGRSESPWCGDCRGRLGALHGSTGSRLRQQQRTPAPAAAEQAPLEGARQGATGVPTYRRWCAGSAIARATTAPPVQRRPRKNSGNGVNFTSRSAPKERKLVNQRWTREVLAEARGTRESLRKTSRQGKCAAISPCRLGTVRQADTRISRQRCVATNHQRLRGCGVARLCPTD